MSKCGQKMCVVYCIVTYTSPVSDADGGIHGKEGEELLIQDFVNAPFPGQQQFGEAAEARIGNSGRVGDSHW